MNPDTVTETMIEASTEVAPITDAPASPEPEPVTFDATYVERLRTEAADYRVKAKRADALARQVVEAYVAGEGRLHDPADLPWSDEYLDDDGLVDTAKVRAAIDQLVERKPYLAARRPVEPIAQGARPEPSSVNLASILRERA
jgi:hypothetical protein